MKFMDLNKVKPRLNLGERMPEKEQEVRRQEEPLRETQMKFSRFPFIHVWIHK